MPQYRCSKSGPLRVSQKRKRAELKQTLLFIFLGLTEAEVFQDEKGEYLRPRDAGDGARLRVRRRRRTTGSTSLPKIGLFLQSSCDQVLL